MFAFHAACEYLLAADFAHQHFILTATFSPRGGINAIKAELRGEHVTIHENGNVSRLKSPDHQSH